MTSTKTPTTPPSTPPSMGPSTSVAPLSVPQRPNIWERLRRWWFDFEPSLPDDVQRRLRRDAIDVAGVDSIDNAFVAACDDASVDEFCADAGIDKDAVVAEVRAAPVEAHVVERGVVAALRAQAAERARRRGTTAALEMFLGCLREGPLSRMALEEVCGLSVVDVLWFASHGDAEDDGDREGALGDDDDAALVVCADEFTPPAFLLRVLRGELQCSAARAEELIGRLRVAPFVVVNVAPAAFQRAVWQRVTEAAMIVGHPLRVRLQRP